MKRPWTNLPWLVPLNVFYGVMMLIGWPYYLFLLATRAKYRAHLLERWGLAPKFARGKKCLWVHAISVGEAEAARTFLPALREAFPDAEVVFSTTTLTGRERARKLFPDIPVFHFPLDLALPVILALARVRPTAVIQVESEWWPMFFWIAQLFGIPVLCVNVRITEKAERGYSWVRRPMAATFNAAVAIGVQAEVYAARLRRLGCHAGRIRVTGQMKHDVVTFLDSVPGADAVAREVGLRPEEAVLVAASTAPEETGTLLAAYRIARRTHGELRLVIVPRRPESFDATAAAIRAAGLPVVRRSRPGQVDGAAAAEPPVILGDTMGEMMKWYALARIIFVGRSLVHLGGSNPMEPGALARPLLWGPEMFNFPVEGPALVEAGAARVVRDAAEMAAAVEELLTRPDLCRQMGEAARATIRGMQGATARSIELVRQTLGAVL